MPVMQNVGQCFHTRPHAVSGRTLLARCNIRVSASHRLPTPLALPGFHRLRRTSGSRGAEMSVVKTISGLASPNSPPQHGQPAATTGTVVVLLSFPAVLSGSENIPGRLPARRPRIRLARTFGKRSRRARFFDCPTSARSCSIKRC